MLKIVLLGVMLSLLAATGATSLALLSIKPDAAARPLATTHLQSLQDQLALP